MFTKLWLYQKSDNLYYRVLKNPQATKALVFLHGLGGSNRYWSSAYKKLGLDASVYFIDLLGFGRSAKPEKELTTADHIRALASFLRTEVNEEEIILVGHSAGSLLALTYTAIHPDQISRAILLGLPYYKTKHEAREYLHTTNHSLATVLDDTPFAHAMCHAVSAFRPLFLATSQQLMPGYPEPVAHDVFLHTHQSYFGTLHHLVYQQNVPYLMHRIEPEKVRLIHGTRDKTVPAANIRLLSTRFGIPLETISDGRHDFPLFEDTRTVQMVRKQL